MSQWGYPGRTQSRLAVVDRGLCHDVLHPRGGGSPCPGSPKPALHPLSIPGPLLSALPPRPLTSQPPAPLAFSECLRWSLPFSSLPQRWGGGQAAKKVSRCCSWQLQAAAASSPSFPKLSGKRGASVSPAGIGWGAPATSSSAASPCSLGLPAMQFYGHSLPAGRACRETEGKQHHFSARLPATPT